MIKDAMTDGRWSRRRSVSLDAGAAALFVLWAACSDSEPRRTATSPSSAVDSGRASPSDAAASGRDSAQPIADDALQSLAEQLIAACPVVARDDAAAREQCANALTELGVLRDSLADPLLWGAQPAELPLERVPEEATLTAFNPRVWRRIYLSTLMFEAPAEVESVGKYRVLKLPTRFRNELDSGDYPYPFWHSAKKWQSYEQTKFLAFFFERGRIIACVRSEELDPDRAHSAREWDGAWTWNDGQEPHVTLYRALFSGTNPFVSELDEAYRTLAENFREQTCVSCHAPNNPSNIKALDILNYPNQALSGRHRVVAMIEQNQMPPDVGIPDETVRHAVLESAKLFARIGDNALDFEGERATFPEL